VLVTAWHSPWPNVALTLNQNSAVAPVSLDAQGKINAAAWAAANGLREDQFIDVGSIPNQLMARVMREADVALFPNRCEGGTNLVAMECLACGIPTIVSDNTGHKDLIATSAPYVLKRQSPVTVPETGTEGWGESDVDEIVEALEHVWANPAEARQRGHEAGAAMTQFGWRDYVRRLHESLAPL
jgi:glycosyltransferase involved in cell wall biosynthesis